MMEALVTILICVPASIITYIVGDKLFKQGVSFRLTTVERDNEMQQKLIEGQQAQITRNREEILLLRQQVIVCEKNHLDLRTEMRAETEKMESSLNENTKAIAKLDATLQGIYQIIKLKLDKQ